MSDYKCSKCGGYKRVSSSNRRDLCGKCYLAMKRKERKEKGLKWKNIIAIVNLIRCKVVWMKKENVPFVSRKWGHEALF